MAQEVNAAAAREGRFSSIFRGGARQQVVTDLVWLMEHGRVPGHHLH